MDKLKANLINKSLSEQVFLVASLISFTSVFMPWFSDSDKFVKGTTYLGLTGPTAFIGLSLMLINGAVFLQEMYNLSKSNYIFGRSITDFFYKSSGFINIYLTGIAISVFSHPATATNLLAKHLLIGSYVSGLSGFLMLSGLLITTKELQKSKNKDKKEKLHSYTVDLSDDESHSVERKHKPINNSLDLNDFDFNYGQDLELDYEAIKNTPVAEIVSSKISHDPSLRKNWQTQQNLANKIDKNDDSNLF